MNFNGQTIRHLETAAGVVAETQHRDATLDAHCHSEATVCMVVRGEVRESGTRYQPGDVIFRNAGDVHADVFGPAGARCFNVSVDRSVLHAPLSSSSAAVPIVKRLRRELRSIPSSLVVEGLIYQLVGEMTRDDARDNHPLAAAVAGFIRERFAERMTVRGIAEHFDVHPVHLARTFRKSYGTTIGDEIRELRIKHAKEMLRGNASLADISIASGFADQSHFTKTFRRVTGTTPRRYRLIF